MAERPRSGALAATAVWLGLILVSGLALWATRPPRAADASATANSFAAARAITHLPQIAKEPRPIGSDEAVRVREYLVEQLHGLGAEVEVEQGIGTASSGRTFHAGLVNNIVGTFPGASNSRAVMLVAHYDSVPEGPGAADDGAGLIVILEAVRALRVGPAMRNDLIVLLTDGEEARGLLGAQAFASSHPDLANRVGLMVNLEARGSSGPGLMFETSDDNGAVIHEFVKCAPYPMATSLMAAIYKRLPNDTDFTPLKAAGLTGLNFAFLETYEAYHSRLDTIENLDPRSIQHLGTNVLGILRHFGNLALPLPKQPDSVYFNWFGSRILAYPGWLAWVTALLGTAFFGFGCIRSATRNRLTLGRTAAGFAAFFLQFLIFMAGSFGAFAVAKLIAGEFLEGDTVSNQLLFAGVMGIGLMLALIGQRIFENKLGLANLAIGELFAVCSVTLVICWFLIGGSYVLQWPLLFGMAGFFLAGRFAEPVRTLCLFLFLIPALLILIPLAYMFFVALTFSYSALAAATFLFTLLLAMAPPLFDRLAGRLKLSLLFVLLLSVSLIAAGIRLSVRSDAHPRQDTLIYSLNADENKAKWISYDPAPDTWTARVLGSTPGKESEPSFTAGWTRRVLSSEATMVPLTAPIVAVTQNTILNGEQTISLRISSSRAARSLLVRLPSDLKVSAAGWNGDIQPVHDNTQRGGPWTFRFYNAPLEGVTLELRYPAQNPIRLWIADSTPVLPAVAPLSPRPSNTTPGYGSDITLVVKALDL
jgi:hypothetical protein